MKEKTYTIKYRQKGNKNGHLFETSCTGSNRKEVLKREKDNMKGTGYMIVSCHLDN